ENPDAPAPAVADIKPVMVDVTRRAAVPDAGKQKEAEKIIKDLFKDQYAKKAAADRKALARQLLDQAAQSASDPAAAWVMFREALRHRSPPRAGRNPRRDDQGTAESGGKCPARRRLSQAGGGTRRSGPVRRRRQGRGRGAAGRQEVQRRRNGRPRHDPRPRNR